MSRIDAIKHHLVEEYQLGVRPAEPADDYDLLHNGVIDSLALLTLVSRLESEYALAIDAMDVLPDSFRTAASIDPFVASAVPTAKVG
ncbi:acyl carrier protein [Streptomyces phytophilus]|uniref:acyl carrier protein n=1 Tax=Streptomyces phytophilus TaxID=722715 RepID=UPI0015F0565A|nr:acyl carrier protein [Streptomyces phytophilus]